MRLRLAVLRQHTFVLLFVALCLGLAAFAYFQTTVVPFAGIGNVQFFDNNGKPLTNGVLYSYQAGTSVQQATYTDSTGTAQNTNPIAFNSGGRASIWLVSGTFYKFVLCVQNDGPVCAPGDILFSVDQVPTTSGSSGGGGGAPFITSSPNPATSGVLRLASGDLTCWRNAAGSGNLCFSKDTNDVLSWQGGQVKLPEVGAPTCAAGFDFIWADNTSHAMKICNNGGIPVNIAFSGVGGGDLNSNSSVVGIHFGSTSTPLSSTAPTTGQFLEWNGTNIVGASVPVEASLVWCPGNGTTNGVCVPAPAFSEGASAQNGVETVLANTHTILRVTYNLIVSTTSCVTPAVLGIRDITTSTNLATVSIPNGGSLGFYDSGALSVATTAGDKVMVGVITAEAGCSPTNPAVANVTVVYQ